MPTLNEYADEDGYYILARPSDTGNITYQLKPRGEQIVEKVGYQDGEEIGWQVISALKVPNLVYTGDGGTTDDDMSVNLDNEEIDALSEEDAKKLLDELSSVPRVGESQTDEIEEILGVSIEYIPDTEEVTATIGMELHEQGIIDERVPDVIAEIEDIGRANFLIISEREAENEIAGDNYFEIHITADFGEQFEKGAFIIKIGVDKQDGILLYETEVKQDITLEIVTECQKLMADILPVVISKLESMGIEVGTPESLPPQSVTNMH